MKRRYKILLVILALLLISSIAIFINRVAIVSYIVPSISSDTIKISVKNDTAFVETKLFAKNKSFIPLTIDSIIYRVGLFNKVYIEEEKKLGIKLKAYDNDTFDFALKIPTGEILRDLTEARKKTKNANYSIYVALQYSTFLGRINLPVNKSAKFKIPTPPEIRAVDVTFSKIRLNYILADVAVNIINFNDVSVTVESLDYTLNVPDQGTATGKYTKPTTIIPQSELTVNLPVKIELNSLSNTLFDVVTDNDTYNYILTCKALVLLSNDSKIPVMIEITKLGTLEIKKPKVRKKKRKRNK